MVPLILFGAVVAVAVLSAVALGSVTWKRMAAARRERDRVAAQRTRMLEAAQLKIEHAAMLAQLSPAPAPVAARVAPVAPAAARVAPVAPVAPVAATVTPLAKGELTSVFAILEQSTPFVRPAAPTPAKTRMAKGSVPIPMTNPQPAYAGALRPAPIAPPPLPRAIPSIVARPAAVPPPLPPHLRARARAR